MLQENELKVSQKALQELHCAWSSFDPAQPDRLKALLDSSKASTCSCIWLDNANICKAIHKLLSQRKRSMSCACAGGPACAGPASSKAGKNHAGSARTEKREEKHVRKLAGNVRIAFRTLLWAIILNARGARFGNSREFQHCILLFMQRCHFGDSNQIWLPFCFPVRIFFPSSLF